MESRKSGCQRIYIMMIFCLLIIFSFVFVAIVAEQETWQTANREQDGQAFEKAMSYLSRGNQRQVNQNNSSLPRKQTGRVANKTSKARRPTVRRILHPSIYAAWDESNHLCALAKFQATFTIKYETSSGSSSQIIDKMPANARGKGRCDQFDDEPVLDITWKDSYPVQSQSKAANSNTTGFTFRIIFQKYNEDDERWGVQQMQLLYNTGHPAFRGTSSAKRFIVRSNKDDYRLQFRTNYGSSLLCPSPPPIQMYDSDGIMRVIARLSNMQLQAFDFGDSRQGSNFDSFERCGQVSFGSGVARQLKNTRSEGLTFVMGIITVCIATLTVVGYAIYRSNALKTKEYKTMG